MQTDFENLCNSLSMTEIIRLQTMLSTALVRRFEQRMALAFSDVVGSTPYFSKFGDAAGRQLQQRHIDLVQQAISPAGGRIVDTAGDGVFLCFPTVDGAASSMIELLKLISLENCSRSREHQLAVRIAIHHGPVLTDGIFVTGDSVNFCARVTGSANPGEIRITRQAFFAFTDVRSRLKCHMLPPVSVKGLDQPAELLVLDWRDHAAFPTMVRLETGQEYELPDQDIISFGRLKERDGYPANDIVLRCQDETQSLQISRWHFELRRRNEGFLIRAVTNVPTELNGRLLEKGEECPLRPGDCVCVGKVLSLRFDAPRQLEEQQSGTATIVGQAETGSYFSARGQNARAAENPQKQSGNESGSLD
jgi:adenylate cyclase